MKTLGLLLIVAVVWLISPATSDQDYRGFNGIVPLHSTRADVEQRLGNSEEECRCVYRTNKEIIFVDYAKAACKGPVNGWNVPVDTVLQFTVTPKIKPLFSDLRVDESKYVKTADDTMTTYYTNVQEGIKYSVQNNFIMDVKYIPAGKDKHLRCEGFPAYDGGVTLYRPYDSFPRKTETETFARLDNFAAELAAGVMSKGYIIAYAGKVSTQGEAKAMAEKARQYLIKMRNVPPDRIIAIDGGFREAAEFELYLTQRTMSPPTSTPTLPLGEVRIIGKN